MKSLYCTLEISGDAGYGSGNEAGRANIPTGWRSLGVTDALKEAGRLGSEMGWLGGGRKEAA